MIPITGLFCAALCSMALGTTLAFSTTESTASPWLQVHDGALTMFGAQIGAYIDNETPNQCEAVAQALIRWPLVVAGMAPAGGPTCPGALMAREWYPYGCGKHWGAIPAARAYILQGSFKWPGCKRATARQRALELKAAMRHHPKLVLWY